MTTLKKLNNDRISITSKLLKKDQDFSPISPEFIKELKDKTLLENSALKLSINDYKRMCSDNTVLSIMAKTLNKSEAKLKKFCKFITVFEENINLSPKSIARKINGPICSLPENIRSTILDKFAEILPTKYVLLDCINKDKLDWSQLSANPNAIDLLLENKDKIYWYLLCNNPSAINLIKERIKYENSLTKEEYNDLYFKDKLNWNNLSTNPNAIELLKTQIKYENNLSEDGLDNLNKWQKINWQFLSANPNAIDLLKENQDKINWKYLSKNPAIFKAV